MTLADINWPLILAGLGLFLFGINYMADWYGSYVCCCNCEQSHIYRQTYVNKKVSRQKR